MWMSLLSFNIKMCKSLCISFTFERLSACNTILSAVFWTFWSLSREQSPADAYTMSPYSNTGSNNDLYRSRLISCDIYCLHIPNVLSLYLALAQVRSMCWLKLSLGSKYNPRYLKQSTCSKRTLSIIISSLASISTLRRLNSCFDTFWGRQKELIWVLKWVFKSLSCHQCLACSEMETIEHHGEYVLASCWIWVFEHHVKARAFGYSMQCFISQSMAQVQDYMQLMNTTRRKAKPLFRAQYCPNFMYFDEILQIWLDSSAFSS